MAHPHPNSLPQFTQAPVQRRSPSLGSGLTAILAACALSVPLLPGASHAQVQAVDPAECAIRTLNLGRFSTDQIVALCRGGGVDTFTCASRALNTGRFNSLDQVVNLCRKP